MLADVKWINTHILTPFRAWLTQPTHESRALGQPIKTTPDSQTDTHFLLSAYVNQKKSLFSNESAQVEQYFRKHNIPALFLYLYFIFAGCLELEWESGKDTEGKDAGIRFHSFTHL